MLEADEITLLNLTMGGYSINAIADKMHITNKTVYRTKQKMTMKLGCDNFNQVIYEATKRGWIS